MKDVSKLEDKVTILKVVSKKTLPTKQDLVEKLMLIVEGDWDEDSVVRPTDAIRAIEVLNKMMGFNEPEESKVEMTQLKFELD